MGATASIREDVEKELAKPLDGSDCGFNGRMEVVKLRRMLHSVDPTRLHQLLEADLPYNLLRYADIPEGLLEAGWGDEEDGEEGETPIRALGDDGDEGEEGESGTDAEGNPISSAAAVKAQEKAARKRVDKSFPKPFTKVLMRDFMSWLDTPGGWNVRSLLCESRKTVDLEGLGLDDATLTSNGALPWRFGAPLRSTLEGGAEGEDGFIDVVNSMLLPEQRVTFIRRYHDLTQRSDTANLYEIVVGDGYEGTPKFKAIYKCVAITGPSDAPVLDEARARIPTEITNNQPHKMRRHFFNTFMIGVGHDAIVEHPGRGGTILEALLRPGLLPTAGSKRRLKWARRASSVMVESVQAMHGQGHTHGDLRPESFVILPSDENNFTVGFGAMQKYAHEVAAEKEAAAAAAETKAARARGEEAADEEEGEAAAEADAGAIEADAVAAESAEEAEVEDAAAAEGEGGGKAAAAAAAAAAAEEGEKGIVHRTLALAMGIDDTQEGRHVDEHFTTMIHSHTANFDEPHTSSDLRRELYDNICLSRIIAMCYADLPAWCASEKGAAHIEESGAGMMQWDIDVTPALLREMMAEHPEWWGEDIAFIEAALLFDAGPLIKVGSGSPKGKARRASASPVHGTAAADDVANAGADPAAASSEATKEGEAAALGSPTSPPSRVKVVAQFEEAVFETQGPFDFCDAFRATENWDTPAVIVVKEKNVQEKEVKAAETGSEGGEVPESMEEEELEMKEDKEELPPISPVMGEWPGSMCCSVMQVRRRVFIFCLRTRSHLSVSLLLSLLLSIIHCRQTSWTGSAVSLTARWQSS